jgi:uncharacterized protein (TIGR02452 family)
MKREDLIKIYKDTMVLTRKTTSGHYKQSDKWSFEDIPPLEVLQETVVSQPHTQIEVINGDTITVALQVQESNPDLDILVLNMASSHVPGGGVIKGMSAQEEELFRRTDYCKCTNHKLYPMNPDEFIITSDVTVVKDENYVRLPDYYKLDFIAMAAVRKPYLHEGLYYDNEEQELMKTKIEAIFRYAAYQDKDALVLGALGCGAYHNPPELVRDMFKEALTKYGKFFKHITFAVLSHNDSNYEIFKSLGLQFQ